MVQGGVARSRDQAHCDMKSLIALCTYCAEPAVAASTVRSGSAPDDPRHIGTKMDPRRVVVVRVCEAHRDRLPDPDRATR